ncbi:MAG: hypothetical protein AB7O97_19580 [Planctomycetota bacterium]
MTAGRWGRRLAAQALLVLIAVLPALVAGLGIAAPPAEGEWQRLAAAAAGPRPLAQSLVADGFLLSTAPAGAVVPDAGTAAADAFLAQARLGQVFGIAAIAFLAYFAVTLAAGRVRALLSLLWLAALPPVAVGGHVLRPETASIAFGLLALLLLQCVWVVQRPAARARGRAAVTIALCATAAVALGLGAAALPAAGGILLLLPGGASMVAALQVGMRLLRSLRQRSIVLLPVRAAAARLWPWVFAAVAALFAAAVLLQVAVRAPEALAASPAAVALFPPSSWAYWPLVALCAFGGLRLVLRIGQRLGRRGRLGADALLLVYCAVLLLQRAVRPAGEDTLPAAVPVAVLLAEGSGYVVLLVLRRLRAR